MICREPVRLVLPVVLLALAAALVQGQQPAAHAPPPLLSMSRLWTNG